MRFEPTIESLKQYRCPEWFRDAKFGIYVHWGAYSVAERGEWYPRQMYEEGSPQYAHHVKTYGHPSEFGYKDFVPLWRAERWDPERLVGLFKRAGARYFAPCAVHHDNFVLWGSRLHRWNSFEMGPRRDITGIWREAALKAGLRFGCTTHMARSYSWLQTNKRADVAGPYAGVPYDGHDPAYRDFSLEPSDDDNRKHPLNPPQHWRQTWLARMTELVDTYGPDLLYFDGAIPFQGEDQGRTGMAFLAHYYNQSMASHNGQQACVMCLKDIPDHGYYVEGAATLDLERRKAEAIRPDPWQTDTSIGPWGYHALRPYRPVKELIHELVDIVSKNGCVMLNVPPKADGTLDADTERILSEIGAWMDVNGEAIYGTRPWIVAEEEGVRFTKKGETLYAVALGWPGQIGRWAIAALGLENVGRQIANVSLLGHGGVVWEQRERALVVESPADPPGAHAFALRVAFQS